MHDVNSEIFNDTKWALLKSIAEKKKSPTEIAEEQKVSISNITQQLKLLEAYGLVKKVKDGTNNHNNQGKPRSIYSIGTEIAHIAILKDGLAEKKLIKLDDESKAIITLLTTTSSEDTSFVIRFLVKHEDLIRKCKAVGLIRTSKENIELFLITDHLDEIRSKFSNMFIDDRYGKTKKVVNWTHNEFEISDGLSRKDKYYMDMLKSVIILFDPSKILQKFKIQRGTD